MVKDPSGADIGGRDVEDEPIKIKVPFTKYEEYGIDGYALVKEIEEDD